MTLPFRRAAVLAALAYLVLSATGDHYWDEYFYLYSVRHHSVTDLIAFEADLSGGLFPDGFFSGKLAFVWFLSWVVGALGEGRVALVAVQGVFAVLPLGVALACYAALRRILDDAVAARVALIALFLPLTVYLGWKPLSEMPALLFVLLSGTAWLRGEDAGGLATGKGWTSFVVAALLLGVASLCRVTALLGLVGLGAAAWLSGRYRFGQLVRSGAVVVALHVLAVMVVLSAFGRPAERVVHLLQSVTSRSVGGGIAVYAVAMTMQMFAPAMLAAFWRLGDRLTLAAIAWAAIAMVPFLVSASYIEPRYFVQAIPALALLADRGLAQLRATASPARFALGLGAIAIVNRLVFAPLMPFEISEPQYRALVDDLDRRSPGATILTPWVTDYCYLSFAYPERRIVMAMSESYANGTAFSSTSFTQWVRPGHYAGDVTTVRTLPTPHYYVGWTYNPSVLRLNALARALDLSRWIPTPSLDALLDHRTPSWMWSSDAFRRTEVQRVGEYYAYEFVDNGGSSVSPSSTP